MAMADRTMFIIERTVIRPDQTPTPPPPPRITSPLLSVPFLGLWGADYEFLLRVSCRRRAKGHASQCVQATCAAIIYLNSFRFTITT